MSEGILPKAYAFHEVESHWYAHWEEYGYFHADVHSSRPPFSIVIPPPNVTGQLHIGHALNDTIQDILCRYKRLKGFEVLWIPGTDHAGIATQNVVERQIGQEGLSRHELGREAFLEKVWTWREKYGGIIINQLKRLGASCDWDRERFTMDEGLSRAVRHVFVRLYEEGLIYRGKRMINWCPRCMTALANIEVEGEEVDSRLYHIRYPLANGKGALVVATTRPETMLGDTAVAVHPEDPRYASFIGQKVILPLVGRLIPVIGDAYVEREFGTGALKVTPSHDFNDFELARKHHLELLQVIGENGAMTEAAGVYAGLDRYACRERILKDLEKEGFLVKVENYKNRVGHCYRCKSVVEPMQSLQWFVSTKPLAEKAMEAVREGKTRIVPAKWEKDYFIWLENVEDWCVSRQIWWGHRIPAWYCSECGKVIVAMDDPTVCPECGGSRLEQDSDVLDTWFSSGLWPFSTLGWPEETAELRQFYPTSVLVTGFDILFFWVARMMMMGLHFMKDVPFRDVYVHALVRDAQGHKMSKSKGNVIDPLVMMDEYGTDALRFTLTAFAVQGRDVKLSEERIEGYKHFINKIWNASRLVLMNLEESGELPEIPAKPAGLVHRWILSRLQRVINEVDASIENYHFNQYAQSLYQFIWHEYCDWYLEMIKPDFYGEDPSVKALAQSVAARVLEQILVLLHPVMPFVTEEIWQKLPQTTGTIMKASFPQFEAERLDAEAEEQMDIIMNVVNGIRNIRGEMNVAPATRVEVVCLCERDFEKDLLLRHSGTVSDLARLSRLEVGRSGEVKKPRLAAGMVAKHVEVYVVLKDILDFESESKRLQKEISKLEKELGITQKKLSNEDFLQKAPEDVIEKEREKGARLGEKMEKLRHHYEIINTLKDSASAGE
ncbi:valine--tRNA ligase [Desulforhabdus amnigena]|uniref:Valine--tRNA ligase n=1 Tax=Desulforhabdus amnigena TaxID=40218 RepID=A0A9W6D6F7_9BACT|nr:valine--tRNA ligase [Desulforhabdus amnigena]NLJ26923.1 valine--tRNA ligase [Deltaproteobacteria bacterium]GLI34511.1 valine--tRNA ligase [Desulforhabdus amnigena]